MDFMYTSVNANSIDRWLSFAILLCKELHIPEQSWDQFDRNLMGFVVDLVNDLLEIAFKLVFGFNYMKRWLMGRLFDC